MYKFLTLLFLIIMLLITVAPRFVESSKIGIIFVFICVVVGIVKIVSPSATKKSDADDAEPKEK